MLAELTAKKSIAFDPNYADTWQYLASVIYSSTFNFSMRSYNDGIKTSTYAVNKSLELNPDHAPSYAILARIQSQQRNFIDSDKNMEKALGLDRKNSYIIDLAASNYMFAGNLEKSLFYRKQLLDINPKYNRNFYNIGQLNYLLNNLDKAYENIDKYLTLEPDNSISHFTMCGVLLAQGKNLLALKHAKKEKNKFWHHYAMSMAVFANGDIQLADELFADFIDENRNTNVTNIARIYAFRGETEKSFEWLYKAFDHPDSTLLFWLNFPEFAKMHNDPRWHELIIKMKLPKSHWLMQKKVDTL
jgi:tetratricopeptide (TPR) repeat protein